MPKYSELTIPYKNRREKAVAELEDRIEESKPKSKLNEKIKEISDAAQSKLDDVLAEHVATKMGDNAGPALASTISAASEMVRPTDAVGFMPMGSVGKGGLKGLDKLKSLKSELQVFQPGGGKVHELANVRQIVDGQLQLHDNPKYVEKFTPEQIEEKLQHTIDRAEEMLYGKKVAEVPLRESTQNFVDSLQKRNDEITAFLKKRGDSIDPMSKAYFENEMRANSARAEARIRADKLGK
jgi:hypothetical protein